MTTPPPIPGPPPGEWPAPAVPLQAAAPPPEKPPVRVWDIVVSSILLVVIALLAAAMSFFGFFLAMAGDPCGVRDCNSDLIAIGLLVAVSLPWVFLLIAAIWTIVRLVRRRVGFWVPLVAIPLVVASFPIGAFIAAAGVPSS